MTAPGAVAAVPAAREQATCDASLAEAGLRRQRDLAIALSVATALPEALDLVLEAALTIDGVDAGGVYLVPASGGLELAAHRGLAPALVSAVAHYAADSPRLAILATGEPVYGRAADAESSFGEAQRREGLTASAVVPISYQSRMIAVVVLASHTRDGFEPEGRAAIEALAAQVGGTIARLRAQEALRRSEERLGDLALTTADWIWETDVHGRYTSCSAKVRDVLGYGPEEVIGKTPFDFLLPGEAERVAPLFAAMVARREGCADLINRNRHRDGREIVLRTSCVPVLDDTGALLGFRGADKDVTEECAARRALEESEARFRLFVENASDILYTLSRDGDLLYASPSWMAALGFSSEDALGRHFASFIHPDDLPAWEAFLAQVVAGESPGREVEYRIRHKDGAWRWHASRGSLVSAADGPLFAGIARDISERKQVQEALRRSEERHRLLAEHANDVIWTMSLDGRITYVSPSVEKTRGLTPEEAMSQPLDEIHPPASAAVSRAYFVTLYEDLAAGRPPQPFHGELEYYRKDGSTVWTEVQVIPHRAADGEVVEILGVTRDISERRAAEEALRRRLGELDALARLSELLVRRVDLSAALDAACDLLVTMFAARAAAVHLAAGAGLGDDDRLLDADVRAATGGALETVIAAALADRQPLETVGADGARLLAVPLVADGEALGVLVIAGQCAATDGVPSSAPEVALARTAADLLAAVIRTEHLHWLETRQAAARERQRIARDLHDAVTQTIYSASLIAEALPGLWERDPEQGRRDLETVGRLVRAALAELRILLYELRPEALTTAPLETLFERLIDALAGQCEIAVALSVSPQIDLPADVKLTFYRVAQEALNNIGKYAQAGHAAVTLLRDVAAVRLNVRDDGRGFDPASARSGMGMSIMRERAAAVGADLRIVSAPGAGTVVEMVWRPAAAEASPKRDGPDFGHRVLHG